jgi:hypothetical protein
MWNLAGHANPASSSGEERQHSMRETENRASYKPTSRGQTYIKDCVAQQLKQNFCTKKQVQANLHHVN